MEDRNLLTERSERFECFLCYRRAIGFFAARAIQDRLEAAGISCFLDLDTSRAGPLSRRIQSVIEQCHTFLLLLTPDTLERCTHPDDWVRIEIETALSSGCTIVPIRMNNFVWPEHLVSQLPDGFAALNDLDSVTLSQEYFEASLRRLIAFIGQPADRLGLPESLFRDHDVIFFLSSISSLEDIAGIDFAFHAGAEWHRDFAKIDFLDLLITHSIPLRVLINSPAIDPLIIHMRKTRKRYVPISENIQEWKEFALAHPDLVELRICTVPLLHCLHLCHRTDGTGCSSIGEYLYGGEFKEFTRRRQVSDSSQADGLPYQAFTDEFNFLWDNLSIPIEDYDPDSPPSVFMEEN